MASRVLALLPYPAQRAVLHRFGRYAPWEPGFDLTPPAPAAGESSGPPDFVGIGAQKAGTTWWYSLIAEHPGVSSRSDIHKERHFLSRFGSQAFTVADLQRYHGWFPRSSGTIAGEWTPDYLSLPWVAPLLKRAAPDAKLVVILRDPVERFASGLAHQLANGMKLTHETVSDAVEKGLYHRHLSWWTEHFPLEQLLVLQYETCAADPVSEIARTYRHLGLDDAFRPARLGARVSSTQHVVPVDPDVASRLAEVYAGDVAALSHLLPSLDVSLWRNFKGVGV
jgi:Sulfotransferase domain